MKISTVAGRFYNAPIVCPICKKSMSVSGGGMTCSGGHNFDFSSKGYINLARKSGDPKYGRELFSARGQILRSGYYDKAVSHIDELLPKGAVLDAGCGEGYFASRLAMSRKMYAIDMAKAGIELCDKAADVRWIVGDLAAIPLADNSMDAVINVLSPANYAEFRRILKKGGVLLKAVPGDAYLSELRRALGREVHFARETVAAFKEHMSEVGQERITYTLPVRAKDKSALFKMTPLTFHEKTVKEVDTITIDIILLYGVV